MSGPRPQHASDPSLQTTIIIKPRLLEAGETLQQYRHRRALGAFLREVDRNRRETEARIKKQHGRWLS